MTTHTFRAEVEVQAACKLDFENAYPEIEITFDYAPSRPSWTPRGEFAPTDPPEPAEVVYRSATLIRSDGLDPTQAQVEEWAQDYLDSDRGYERACREAENNSGPDPDEWYDRKREEG